MKTNKTHFGITKELLPADLYTLSNDNGMSVSITNYGAIIQSLFVADRDGNFEDVVLGYDKLEDYIKSSPYFGSIVGRYCNRIANAKFILDGIEYNLAQNKGAHHLHGGIIGFDKVIWDALTYQNENEATLELTYLSKDGEEGYPGNLLTTVKYILTNEDQLVIDYKAETDKKTHVNLTNHSYFNLSGNLNNNILEHELWLNSETFLHTDNKSIPVGGPKSVYGTPFDFTKSTKIGLRINDSHEQLIFGKGYDHCMIFKESDEELPLRATVYESASGRFMELFTTEPAFQFYTGNYLDGSYVGKQGIVYNHRAGFCLETGHFPDTPNKPDYPSTILNPGEIYNSKTVFKFGAK